MTCIHHIFDVVSALEPLEALLVPATKQRRNCKQVRRTQRTAVAQAYGVRCAEVWGVGCGECVRPAGSNSNCAHGQSSARARSKVKVMVPYDE